MIINDTQFNAELSDIIDELQAQLRINNIPLLAKVKDIGKDIQICCPYHANGLERRPSAGIRKTDGKFHCFACGEIHTLSEVISHCFGYDNDMGKFGWMWLLKNFAIIDKDERTELELDFTRASYHELGKPVKPDYVTEEELDTYRYYHPYWTERGITDERIIELFDLGYDKESQCITFPVRDIQGRTLFVARRNIHTKFFNYPSGAEKPLYGLYELHEVFKDTFEQQHNYPCDIIICESMIDCLRLWQNKMYAVALNGLGSASQIADLQKLPCRKYILCTDSDSAGMDARKQLHRALGKYKIVTEFILPEGRKDVGECSDIEIQNLQEIF